MTPLHLWNSHTISEKCKSRGSLTSFNRIGPCMSYKQVKEDKMNLAKYVIMASERSHAPIPSHFSLNKFTLVAMDSFDHTDRSSLSSALSNHDTIITLFQIKPDIPFTERNKNTVVLKM